MHQDSDAQLNGERKGSGTCIYSAYRQYNLTTKRSDVDHTELPANTPHLPGGGSYCALVPATV